MYSKVLIFKDFWAFRKALKSNPNINGVSQTFLDAKGLQIEDIKLVNCEGCWNSNECVDCVNLEYSTHCKKCRNCKLLVNCEQCENCYECENIKLGRGEHRMNSYTSSKSKDELNLTLLIVATFFVGSLITYMLN